MKKLFDQLTPKQKRILIFSSGIFILFFVLFQFVSATNSGEKKIKKTIEEISKKYPNILSTRTGDGKYLMEKLQSQNRILKDENELLKLSSKKLFNQMDTVLVTQKALKKAIDIKVPQSLSEGDVIDIITKHVKNHPVQLSESERDETEKIFSKSNAANTPDMTETEQKIDDFGQRILNSIKKTKPEPYYPNPYAKNDNQNVSTGQREIRVIEEPTSLTMSPEKQIAEKLKKEQENSIYIPTSTNMRGILLSGMAARTSISGQKDPMAIFIMLRGEATLPNRKKVNVDEAFVMAHGFGDLSSQRALCRTDRFSMVLDDGSVIDIEMDAVVLGLDGKFGIRGPFKSHDHELMLKAMAAGVLSGFSSAVKPTAVLSLQTDPTNSQQFQTPGMETILQSGAYQGASTALDMAARRYLRLAESIQPTIEINSGQEVELMVTKGFWLRIIGENKS